MILDKCQCRHLYAAKKDLTNRLLLQNGIQWPGKGYHSFLLVMLGKAMVAYTKPQQRKKEESKRLRGERSDQIC